MRHHKRYYRRMACLQIFGKERIGTERSARGDQRLRVVVQALAPMAKHRN